MIHHDNLGFEPLYPDVLGAIAGGLRIDLGDLQAAVGIYPRSAFYNQPIEIIVILQNMVDCPVESRVEIFVPAKDERGEKIRLAAPKGAINQLLGGGEVGVMRLPIMPMLPTQPNPELKIEVSVRTRSKGGLPVRPPTGAAPPSVLAVSPFKMQALREVEFSDPIDQMRGENVIVAFEVSSKQMPMPTTPLKPTYEPLWTQQSMQDERLHIVEQLDHARMVATTFTPREIFETLRRSTDEVFALRGMPLHPGEVRAIAKLLTYTLSDHSDSDAPGSRMEDQRWFQALAQTLAHDEKVARWRGSEIVGRYLYESAIYDATLLGFTLIRPKVQVNLGDRAERIAYADRLIRWLAGQYPPDLSFAYLPLVLGGVVVNHLVTGTGDDAWNMLEELHEAYRGRVRLVEGEQQEIFDMLDKLLQLAEDDLRRAQILRS